MQQIIFLLLIAGVAYQSYTRYARVYQNIQLGKAYSPTGSVAERIKNVVLIALGQEKMFKNFIPAIFHFFIYAAFLLTQIELIEIILDGITGNHRLFANSLGGLYTLIINLKIGRAQV